MSPPRPTRLGALSALSILVVIGGCLVWAIFQRIEARHLAGAALVLYVALEARRVGPGGRRMLAACATIAAATLIWRPDAVAVLGRALAEAAFVVGLFTSLGMLRDVAETSALVRACGETMVRQPPGRRYAVLSLGSHVIALALNFGVLPLLGVMITRGNTLDAAAGDPAVQAIRKRRMMTAILRGFALMTVWSPLSVSFVVTQSAMHGLPWGQLLAVQIPLALMLMLLGWLLDRKTVPAASRRPSGPPIETDWTPILRLCLLIAIIVIGAVAAAELLSTRMVTGAMLVVPAAALVWQMAQAKGSGLAGMAESCGGFGRRLFHSLPNLRYEVAIMGGAMFFGSVAGTFLSPQDATAVIARLDIPPILLTIVLVWLVMLLAQIGISQIISVTLLGGALGGMSDAGVVPLVAASGLMGAWALSACSTTVGAAVMTVARMSEVSIATVARDWNARFVLMGAALLGLWMLALSRVLP